MISSVAFAACGPNALGTHRTIVLDPKEHTFFAGDEKRLGLKSKEVILTFDDGPIGSRTRRVLKALREECVRATFFTVAEMAREHKKLLRRIVRDGHTLGHHTYAHNRLPRYSVNKASKLIDSGITVVEKIAYGDVADKPRVPFFRYPYLARSRAMDRMVAKKGLIVFDTNIDSSDWHPTATANIVHNRIMRRLRSQKKGIILMHDIHNRTARMLPRLLRTLKREGYKVVHIVPPYVEPPVKPAPDTPVVIASAEEAPAKNKSLSIVELKPVSRQNASGDLMELLEPVGSPAEAHGTDIDLKELTRPASKLSKVTPPATNVKPIALKKPETVGKISRHPGDTGSIVTHSVRPASKKTSATVVLNTSGWKLRTTH